MKYLALLFSMVVFMSSASLAQDVPALAEQPPASVSEDAVPDPVVVQEAAPAMENAELDGVSSPAADLAGRSLMDVYPSMSSLFFSRWEHDLIIEARKGLNVRPPEAAIEDLSSPAAIQPGEMGPRELSLGGIVYHSPKNWTVWLNGMRVTPKGLPEQVMNLKVFKDYIEIEWLDTSTNQIYPIRLRPHQRFNLDTRIFLPG